MAVAEKGNFAQNGSRSQGSESPPHAGMTHKGTSHLAQDAVDCNAAHIERSMTYTDMCDLYAMYLVGSLVTYCERAF